MIIGEQTIGAAELINYYHRNSRIRFCTKKVGKLVIKVVCEIINYFLYRWKASVTLQNFPF